MNKFIVLALVLVASYGSKAEDNAHDVIIRANQQALEEDLAFGIVDQPRLIEGDIVYDEHTRAMMEEERRVASGGASAFDALNRGKWPNGVVPYVIDGSLRGNPTNVIYKAIQEYKTKIGCVTFVPRSGQRDYVRFYRGRGCFSMIGRTGRGRQDISIGNGCASLATVIHEMMHAIGFFHEQSRTDRDKYVIVNRYNIQRGMEYNFNKYRPGEASTYNEPYDMGSVMHYSRYAFSRNRRPTILSRTNSNQRLGNNYGFSKTDIIQIKKHYGCHDGTKPQPPQPGDCKDISHVCADHKHKCQTNDFVLQRCQKTCGAC